MRKIKLVIQYQGTQYQGWQVQPTGPTIQGIFEEILGEICHEKVVLIGSGRTDSGVHALAQVAHFSTSHGIDLETLHRALNAKLPYDIVVLSVAEAPGAFDAQKSAKRKTYTYFFLHSDHKSPFLSSYSWRVWGDLDLEGMQECLDMLVGEHDFASFKAADSTAKTSVRRIEAARLQRVPLRDVGNSLMGLFGLAGILPALGAEDSFHPEAEAGPALIAVTLQGPGFLKHMVRNIVGTLLEVGLRRIGVEEFREILAARDRTRAGATAPAWGLFLVQVEY
ncbi:tRNA pseudouridine(38-40) synthase TruA [Deltaproteobacteria bacterium PRO3]|nr:tRNA pseudouridine(38-40) synthase TruA [Deltaproteobacteria bacterium PRO3]